MKSIEAIRKLPRLTIIQEGADGGWAEVQLGRAQKARSATVVFSWGGGWDHVSVRFDHKTPTWREMVEIKCMFFRPNEACMQFYPADYDDKAPVCLHMWRPQATILPMPPRWMVGIKDDQTPAGAYTQFSNPVTYALGHEDQSLAQIYRLSQH